MAVCGVSSAATSHRPYRMMTLTAPCVLPMLCAASQASEARVLGGGGAGAWRQGLASLPAEALSPGQTGGGARPWVGYPFSHDHCHHSASDAGRKGSGVRGLLEPVAAWHSTRSRKGEGRHIAAAGEVEG